MSVLIGLAIGIPVGAIGALVLAIVTSAARAGQRRGLLELDTPEARRAVNKPW